MDFTTDQRQALVKSGEAMPPDGAYPIRNKILDDSPIGDGTGGALTATRVRINGQDCWVADDGIEISAPRRDEIQIVTVKLICRRVVIAHTDDVDRP